MRKISISPKIPLAIDQRISYTITVTIVDQGKNLKDKEQQADRPDGVR